MGSSANKIRKQARALPPSDKIRLVDALLSDLDKPDPDIDRVWVAESQRRWRAYKSGKTRSVLYKEVLKRLKKK